MPAPLYAFREFALYVKNKFLSVAEAAETFGPKPAETLREFRYITLDSFSYRLVLLWPHKLSLSLAVARWLKRWREVPSLRAC